jgi:UbiD family decarboxylase
MDREPLLRDLRALLQRLEVRGELVRVEAEVDPRLELAEIHRRVIAAGGPALLFVRPRGARFPAVSNLFGTLDRVRAAFGTRALDWIAEAAAAPRELLPPRLGRLWKKRRFLGSLLRVGTRLRRRGPVLGERMDPPDARALPATTSWPEDGGPFLTLPLVYTEHPRTREHNLGIYRMQVRDRDRLGMHWQIGKGGGFHHAAAELDGQELPVAVSLGGPPALLLAALAPLPENVPELLLASLVLGRRLDLVRPSGFPLPVAAGAEFALHGVVPAGLREDEGPFGDHYGYYSLAHPFPVFRLLALHHRPDAILPVTVVGKPRQEDFHLGEYLQGLLRPLFPLAMPGVVDLWSYGEAGFHPLSAAIVRQRYRREAMASAFRILGEGQLSLTKFLLVTDQPVDLHDIRATLVCILERADLRTDLYVLANLSMDTLDYAGPRLNEGSKGVLLGVGEARRRLPVRFQGGLPAGVVDIEPFCPGVLCATGLPYAEDPEHPSRVARHPSLADWPLVVLVDDARATARSPLNFLWTTFTRFDPARDLHAARTELLGSHVAFEAPVVLDARKKPSYPSELFVDAETRERVDRRWTEYFPRGMAQGSSDRADLD